MLDKQKNILGEAAKKIREQQGLSQKDAATRLGITPVHLCNLENGKAKPSLDLVSKFREVFGADLYVVSWLLFGDFSRLPSGVRDASRRLSEQWRRELEWQL